MKSPWPLIALSLIALLLTASAAHTQPPSSTPGGLVPLSPQLAVQVRSLLAVRDVLERTQWRHDTPVDETGEWEVVGPPYTTAGGKITRARVRRVDQPAAIDIRLWSAHERIAVRRG